MNLGLGVPDLVGKILAEEGCADAITLYIESGVLGGVTLGGTLLTTIDGIRINKDCQALDAEGNPIDGLYAAGDCSGSVFSGCYPDQLHGFACGRTMTEAIHVVKQMA